MAQPKITLSGRVDPKQLAKIYRYFAPQYTGDYTIRNPSQLLHVLVGELANRLPDGYDFLEYEDAWDALKQFGMLSKGDINARRDQQSAYTATALSKALEEGSMSPEELTRIQDLLTKHAPSTEATKAVFTDDFMAELTEAHEEASRGE